MRKPARMVLWVVAAFIFFSPALFVSIAGAQAKSATPIEGVKFDTQNSLGIISSFSPAKTCMCTFVRARPFRAM